MSYYFLFNREGKKICFSRENINIWLLPVVDDEAESAGSPAKDTNVPPVIEGLGDGKIDDRFLIQINIIEDCQSGSTNFGFFLKKK